MKKVLLAGLVLGLMPTFAVAADLGPYPRSSVKDAPPPVYYNTVASWQGFYAGIQGGYGWGDTNASTLFGSVNSYNYSPDGFVGGIHAGYNWQVDRLVFGVESDLEASNISGSGSFANNSHATDVDWLGSVRARFGIAADRTLFYATGGLAYGDVHEHEFLPGSDGTVFRTGWTAGAGIEHQISRGLTARIEYRYTDLGSSTNTFNGVTDTNDTTFGAVRAGLSWKF